MKAPSPAFSLYPKDIESDETCKAMTHAEFGMYMRLLLNCWTEGSIPADPIRLQRLLKVSSKTFKACWPAIEPCFTPAGDRLTQSRLEEERTRQRERSLINSERGRKGGRPTESTPEVKPRLSPGKAELKPDESLSFASPFPSPSSTSEQTDPGRFVKAETTATPDGTPVKLSDLDGSTATAPRRLTPQALGIRTDPANFAQVQLAHDLTALVDAWLRDLGHEPKEPKQAALELLHDVSTTPAGKRIETLDLRRVPSPWCSVSSHAARKLALEVYGVELDSSVPREDDPASVALGEAIKAKFATPAESSPAPKAPTLSVTVAPGRCPMCDGALTHFTEADEKVLRCADEQGLRCDWAAVWREVAA